MSKPREDRQSCLRQAAIIQRLPDFFRPTGGEALPDMLIGATIMNAGTLQGCGTISGGGLVLDFVPKGSVVVCRVVLAFNDVGMWVEFRGDT